MVRINKKIRIQKFQSPGDVLGAMNKHTANIISVIEATCIDVSAINAGFSFKTVH